MVRVASHEGARQSGLVLGASEQPSGHDEQLGQFFQQMRAATGLPPLMIAARLGIDQTVLMALEGGQVLALPDWPETVRFVTAYGRLAGFDPNPVLHRIRAQRTTGGAAVPVPAPAAAGATGAPRPQTEPRMAAGRPLPPAAPYIPLAQSGAMHPQAPASRQQMPGFSGSPQQPPHNPSSSYANGQGVPPRTSTPQSAPAQPAWLAAQATRTGTAASAPAPFPQGAAQAGWLPPLAPQTPRLAPPPMLVHSPAPAQAAGGHSLSPVNPLQPPPRPPRPEAEAAQRQMEVETDPQANEAAAPSRRRMHPANFALRYVTGPMLVVAGLWYTVQNPTTVHAALGQLPEPLPSIARAGMDLVLVSTAPTKDGLRMIPTGDPRSRKADRLPVRK